MADELMRIEFTIEPWSDTGHPPYVVAALSVVEASGLQAEAGPFGTSVVGPADEVYELSASVLRAAMEAGAGRVSLQARRVDDDG